MDISDRRDLTIDERWHPPHLGQSATFPCVPVSCVPVVHQDRKGRENYTLEIAFDRIASARRWKAHTAVAQFVPDRPGIADSLQVWRSSRNISSDGLGRKGSETMFVSSKYCTRPSRTIRTARYGPA